MGNIELDNSRTINILQLHYLQFASRMYAFGSVVEGYSISCGYKDAISRILLSVNTHSTFLAVCSVLLIEPTDVSHTYRRTLKPEVVLDSPHVKILGKG